VYRRGGQLTLVYQYDVFFSCLLCIVCRKGENEKGYVKECGVRVVLECLVFLLFIKFLNRCFLHDSKRADRSLICSVSRPASVPAALLPSQVLYHLSPLGVNVRYALVHGGLLP